MKNEAWEYKSHGNQYLYVWKKKYKNLENGKAKGIVSIIIEDKNELNFQVLFTYRKNFVKNNETPEKIFIKITKVVKVASKT